METVDQQAVNQDTLRPGESGDVELQRHEARQEIVIPLVEETFSVEKRRVETGGVHVHKTVQEFDEVVDVPLMHESVNVERVAVNRYVQTADAPRQEGDTFIVPLYEEVLVVEKRLLLKEELRITRTQSETNTPQRVTLRREEATIERIVPVQGQAGSLSETGSETHRGTGISDPVE